MASTPPHFRESICTSAELRLKLTYLFCWFQQQQQQQQQFYFFYVNASTLVNTDTVRSGGGEKTLRSSRLPPPRLSRLPPPRIKLKSMSVRSWRWTSLRLPRNPRIAARVLLKRAIWALSLCMLWQMHTAPCVFQLFFLPVFCLLSFCCILVPSLQLLWRQGDWMKTSLCQSLFDSIYLCRNLKKAITLMMKNWFLQKIQSCSTNKTKKQLIFKKRSL